MRRRQQQQLKAQEEMQKKTHTISIATKSGIPVTNDKSIIVPPEILEQVHTIKEAIKSGKKLCDHCLKLFDTKLGLNIHQKRWCKGR
jgi:hypothetical protein